MRLLKGPQKRPALHRVDSLDLAKARLARRHAAEVEATRGQPLQLECLHEGTPAPAAHHGQQGFAAGLDISASDGHWVQDEDHASGPRKSPFANRDWEPAAAPWQHPHAVPRPSNQGYQDLGYPASTPAKPAATSPNKPSIPQPLEDHSPSSLSEDVLSLTHATQGLLARPDSLVIARARWQRDGRKTRSQHASPSRPQSRASLGDLLKSRVSSEVLAPMSSAARSLAASLAGRQSNPAPVQDIARQRSIGALSNPSKDGTSTRSGIGGVFERLKALLSTQTRTVPEQQAQQGKHSQLGSPVLSSQSSDNLQPTQQSTSQSTQQQPSLASQQQHFASPCQVVVHPNLHSATRLAQPAGH